MALKGIKCIGNRERGMAHELLALPSGLSDVMGAWQVNGGGSVPGTGPRPCSKRGADPLALVVPRTWIRVLLAI